MNTTIIFPYLSIDLSGMFPEFSPMVWSVGRESPPSTTGLADSTSSPPTGARRMSRDWASFDFEGDSDDDALYAACEELSDVIAAEITAVIGYPDSWTRIRATSRGARLTNCRRFISRRDCQSLNRAYCSPGGGFSDANSPNEPVGKVFTSAVATRPSGAKPPFWRETWFYEQPFYVLVCLTPAMLASWQMLATKGPITTRDTVLLVGTMLASSSRRRRGAWRPGKARCSKCRGVYVPEVRCARRCASGSPPVKCSGAFMSVATAPTWWHLRAFCGR